MRKTSVALCGQGDKSKQTFQAIGKAGEEASGLTKNFTRIPSFTDTAKYRIPDALDSVNKTISEVKNVSYQSYTNQLRDFVSYAQNTGYRFELYVRSNTQLSNTLQKIVNSGQVIIKTLNKLK